MKTLYFSYIFLLSFIVSIYAATCPANAPDQSCPFAGIGRETCPGQGTTNLVDLLGVLYKPEGRYCMLGQTRGLYYIISVNYDVLPGARATLTFRALVGYAIEVPDKSGQGESTIYLITITGCAEVRIVKKNSRRKLTGTPLTDATIYNAIQASHRPYNAPCNPVVGADLRRYPQNFDYLALDLPLDVSRAISFQYIPFNSNYSTVPDKVIRKNQFRVSGGKISGTYTYVESDYLNINGDQECSTRPDNGIPLGVALNAVGFNFTLFVEIPQRGLCVLSLQISKFGAITFYPYFFYYERIILLAAPYDVCIVLAGYVDTDLGIPLNKKIVQLC